MDLETRLTAVANIRVYYAKTLAKSLSKPSLFDAPLLCGSWVYPICYYLRFYHKVIKDYAI